jgi:hypothetical protein
MACSWHFLVIIIDKTGFMVYTALNSAAGAVSSPNNLEVHMDIEKELSGPEWAILCVAETLVLMFAWTLQLGFWLASSSIWGKADRVVGTAILRGWTRFSNLVDRAIHSRTATIALGVMLVIIAGSTALLLAGQFSPGVREWLTPR